MKFEVIDTDIWELGEGNVKGYWGFWMWLSSVIKGPLVCPEHKGFWDSKNHHSWLTIVTFLLLKGKFFGSRTILKCL